MQILHQRALLPYVVRKNDNVKRIPASERNRSNISNWQISHWSLFMQISWKIKLLFIQVWFQLI